MSTYEKDRPIDGEMSLTRDEFISCVDEALDDARKGMHAADWDEERASKLRFEAKFIAAFLIHDWWEEDVAALGTNMKIGACGCLIGTVRHKEDPENVVPEDEYMESGALDEEVGTALDVLVVNAIKRKYNAELSSHAFSLGVAVRIF